MRISKALMQCHVWQDWIANGIVQPINTLYYPYTTDACVSVPHDCARHQDYMYIRPSRAECWPSNTDHTRGTIHAFKSEPASADLACSKHWYASLLEVACGIDPPGHSKPDFCSQLLAAALQPTQNCMHAELAHCMRNGNDTQHTLTCPQAA